MNKPDAHVLSLYPFDDRSAQDEDIHLRPEETVEFLVLREHDKGIQYLSEFHAITFRDDLRR